MDPTKTNSYRRWRNKIMTKGFSGTFLSAGETSKSYPGFSGTQKAEKRCGFRQLGEETEIQSLLKILEVEYRKIAPLRREKVMEIKKLIQKGQYLVPGKLVVEKWFPS